MAENAREIVLDILLELNKGGFDHLLLRQVLDKYDYLDPRDKAFIKRVTEGCIERRIELDYVLNQFSSVKVHKMKPLIRCLMRMSTYQILYMDSIPDSAVCNEAVKLANKRKFKGLSGFVNGVLRSISREKERIKWPDKDKDWKQYLHVRCSIPEWILSLWEADLGKDKTMIIAESLLNIRPLTVRVNETLNQAEAEELTAAWKREGIGVKQSGYLPYAYELENVAGLASLPGFDEGAVTVQDVSSMMVAQCAGIRENDCVIDVCAAPGGKTLHAACKLRGTGRVLSCDLTEYKTDLIRQAAERMKADNVKVETADASIHRPELEAAADVLFLDVPCSGLGILGRKRDIKYHVTEESLAEILLLQKSIIDACWSYVKPGGVLMYSTCTIRRAENEDAVNYITENYPFETESLDIYLPENLRSSETSAGKLQLLPGIHESDGFFVARLRRKTES